MAYGIPKTFQVMAESHLGFHTSLRVTETSWDSPKHREKLPVTPRGVKSGRNQAPIVTTTKKTQWEFIHQKMCFRTNFHDIENFKKNQENYIKLLSFP